MLKLPPPIWGLIYLAVGGAVSWFYRWRAVIDLRVLWLGITLIVLGLALALTAVSLFRRRGAEMQPTSETTSCG